MKKQQIKNQLLKLKKILNKEDSNNSIKIKKKRKITKIIIQFKQFYYP